MHAPALTHCHVTESKTQLGLLGAKTLLNHLPSAGFYLERLLSAVLQYPKLAGQNKTELKALVFVSHLGHSGHFINKRYKREACSRCASSHTEGSIVTYFLRISDEQAFILPPPHPESSDTQICRRERYQIHFGVPQQTKNAKSQVSCSRARAAAWPLQEIKAKAGSPLHPGL